MAVDGPSQEDSSATTQGPVCCSSGSGALLRASPLMGRAIHASGQPTSDLSAGRWPCKPPVVPKRRRLLSAATTKRGRPYPCVARRMSPLWKTLPRWQTCIQFNCPFWTPPKLGPFIVPITSRRAASEMSYPMAEDTSKSARPACDVGRRFLAATVVVPPDVAEHLNTDAMAVLAVIRDEARATGRCTLPVARIAKRANIGRAKTRAAIKLAEGLGLIAIEEASDRKRVIINRGVTTRC